MAYDLRVGKVARLPDSLKAGAAFSAVGVLVLASLPALSQRTSTRPRPGSGTSGQPISGQFKPSQPIAGRNSGFAPTNFTRITNFNAPLPKVPLTNIGTP